MRTTLTLDEDVAILLTRVQKARGLSLKNVVNEALREGLQCMSQPPVSSNPYSTGSASLGGCLIANIDDIGEALAIAEGDAYR